MNYTQYEAKYDKLLQENELLFTVDLIKEKLTKAYDASDEPGMSEGIIAHATKTQPSISVLQKIPSHSSY